MTAQSHFTAERESRTQLKTLASHAWITYALVALNVAVWITMGIASQSFTQALSKPVRCMYQQFRLDFLSIGEKRIFCFGRKDGACSLR